MMSKSQLLPNRDKVELGVPLSYQAVSPPIPIAISANPKPTVESSSRVLVYQDQIDLCMPDQIESISLKIVSIDPP